MIISNHKIKIKSDEALTEAFIRALNEILDENHVILDNFSDKTEVS